MENWYIIINWSLSFLQSKEKKEKLKADFLYSIPDSTQEVTVNLVFWSWAFLGYGSLSYFPCFYDPGSLRALPRDIIVWSSIGICLILFFSGNWADMFKGMLTQYSTLSLCDTKVRYCQNNSRLHPDPNFNHLF